MAHRGRLNVLAHIVGVTYEAILAEFEAGRGGRSAQKGGSDDVKYHLGAEGTFHTPDGAELSVTLSPNPSHLEAVNPVVEGRARAQQSDRRAPLVAVDRQKTLPILIHGDAAFAAQGVVAETFNMARLAGYTTGGTIHIIANNQIGFTTGPARVAPPTYSSDLAKGFDVPIIHVNADDPEATAGGGPTGDDVSAALPRRRVIDLVGYRRYGHNEGDDPAYTQPSMYAAVEDHPSVRELYAKALVKAGVRQPEEGRCGCPDHGHATWPQRQAAVRKQHAEPQLDRGRRFGRTARIRASRRRRSRPPTLQRLNEQLYRWPADLPHQHQAGQAAGEAASRRSARRTAAIEWAHAEALALASLLVEGVPIRLTGQDTVRGTFSQRHQTLWDAETGAAYTPIQHLEGAGAAFELHNSPLSEYAAVGFEYGYAVTAPEALVLWEAQYGDFVNGAEIIIDQFIIAGLAKWRQTSRLTLLLPHGYEGSGPEHSSARLERFLALGAEGNIRVVYPTTPAQYFHLLRRQARHADLRPLIVMTPKSLLRLPEAASRPAELSSGAFASVLDDPAWPMTRRPASRGSIVCSGKVYYDLTASEERAEHPELAIVRTERLYPFPTEDLERVHGALSGRRARHLGAGGAAQHGRPQVRAAQDPAPGARSSIPLGDISRPERSRPAEGYPAAHTAEQARIVHEALTS